MTFVSRMTGFVRDLVFASLLGAGTAMDVFVVGFRVPNLFRRLFAEGALSQAVVPVLADTHEKTGDAPVKKLFSTFFWTLGGFLLLFCAFCAVEKDVFIRLFAPGFLASPDKFALAADFLAIAFFYLFFISMAAACQGMLNVLGHFWVSAASPVLLNLVLIGAAFLAARHVPFDTLTLAWGVVAAGALQLIVHFPPLAQRKFLPGRPGEQWRGLKRIITTMIPALFGMSSAQLSLFLNTAIASFLVPGSLSWIYYADRLMEFPVGVLGAALSTVFLPALSRASAAGESRLFSRLFQESLFLAILSSLLCGAAMVAAPLPLVETLFGRGAFSGFDAKMTAQAVTAYALGVVPLVALKVPLAAFFARHDTKTPAKSAFLGLLVTQGANLLLVPAWGHAGLCAAIALGAWAQMGYLLMRLFRDKVFSFSRRLWLWGMKLGFAFGLSLAFFLLADAWWNESFKQLARIAALGAVLGLGTGAYFATLWTLGFRPRQVALSLGIKQI